MRRLSGFIQILDTLGVIKISLFSDYLCGRDAQMKEIGRKSFYKRKNDMLENEDFYWK